MCSSAVYRVDARCLLVFAIILFLSFNGIWILWKKKKRSIKYIHAIHDSCESWKRCMTLGQRKTVHVIIASAPAKATHTHTDALSLSLYLAPSLSCTLIIWIAISMVAAYNHIIIGLTASSCKFGQAFSLENSLSIVNLIRFSDNTCFKRNFPTIFVKSLQFNSVNYVLKNRWDAFHTHGATGGFLPAELPFLNNFHYEYYAYAIILNDIQHSTDTEIWLRFFFSSSSLRYIKPSHLYLDDVSCYW